MLAACELETLGGTLEWNHGKRLQFLLCSLLGQGRQGGVKVGRESCVILPTNREVEDMREYGQGGERERREEGSKKS